MLFVRTYKDTNWLYIYRIDNVIIKKIGGKLMITTCIFDLDGTLVDSLEDLADTVNQLLEQYHYPLHSLEAYKRFVGNGIDILLERSFGIDDSSFLKKIRKEFDCLYQKNYLHKTRPYQGIVTVLKQLQQKGIQMAVVTNKDHRMAELMVKKLFPDIFLYTYGTQVGIPYKPNPTIVNQVIHQMHANKESCVFIGDSDVDIITGKNAQIKTIGVAWGFRGTKELVRSGADAICQEPSEIGGVINDWSK